MLIRECGADKFQDLKELWEALNRHHESCSVSFKDRYRSFTFDERWRSLVDNDRISIFVAEEDSEVFGYCIATAKASRGEIDSLYVKERARGKGTGTALVERAFMRLKEWGCLDIRVIIADGNNEAFPFYKRLGFAERYRVYELK